MPRCGQISRNANGWPCWLRQITSGAPSRIWAFIFPGRTREAAMAGYQKPSKGELGEGRKPVSSVVSIRCRLILPIAMPHDSVIAGMGQGARFEKSRSTLTILQGLCYKDIGSFLEAMIFLRVPVGEVGYLTGSFFSSIITGCRETFVL